MRKPQGVASLALGYVLHWAFSPPLLNPKLQYLIYRHLYYNLIGNVQLIVQTVAATYTKT